MDEHLLRALVNGHSKTALEFLYLESGAIPIRFILACWRMTYYPTKGDFYCQVLKDFELIGEEEVAIKSKTIHKNNIKQKIKNAALSFLLSF